MSAGRMWVTKRLWASWLTAEVGGYRNWFVLFLGHCRTLNEKCLRFWQVITSIGQQLRFHSMWVYVLKKRSNKICWIIKDPLTRATRALWLEGLKSSLSWGEAGKVEKKNMRHRSGDSELEWWHESVLPYRRRRRPETRRQLLFHLQHTDVRHAPNSIHFSPHFSFTCGLTWTSCFTPVVGRRRTSMGAAPARMISLYLGWGAKPEHGLWASN